MSRKVLHVALNGVTGRMGYRQHLVRSLLSIREQGGVRLADGTAVYPEPILVGRNEERLRDDRRAARPAALDDQPRRGAGRSRGRRCTSTPRSPARASRAWRQAIAAGQARLHREAGRRARWTARCGWPRPPREAGITNGVVQDKLFLPGMIKLRRLVRDGLLRPGPVGPAGVRLLGLRGRRHRRPAAVLELPQGGRRRHRARHVPALAVPARGSVRPDHARCTPGRRRTCRGGGTSPGSPTTSPPTTPPTRCWSSTAACSASVNSSWAVRVNRRELVELQVDGTHGSAVAGLRNCAVQHRVATPDAGVEPGPARPDRLPGAVDRRPGQQRLRQRVQGAVGAVPDGRGPRAGRSPWDLAEGAKGVQLAGLALQSSAEGRRVEVPPL